MKLSEMFAKVQENQLAKRMSKELEPLTPEQMQRIKLDNYTLACMMRRLEEGYPRIPDSAGIKFIQITMPSRGQMLDAAGNLKRTKAGYTKNPLANVRIRLNDPGKTRLGLNINRLVKDDVNVIRTTLGTSHFHPETCELHKLVHVPYGEESPYKAVEGFVLRLITRLYAEGLMVNGITQWRVARTAEEEDATLTDITTISPEEAEAGVLKFFEELSKKDNEAALTAAPTVGDEAKPQDNLESPEVMEKIAAIAAKKAKADPDAIDNIADIGAIASTDEFEG